MTLKPVSLANSIDEVSLGNYRNWLRFLNCFNRIVFLLASLLKLPTCGEVGASTCSFETVDISFTSRITWS